jgi:hypothetical protein
MKFHLNQLLCPFTKQGPVSLHDLRLRPIFDCIDYFVIQVDVFIKIKESRKMFLCQVKTESPILQTFTIH